MGDLLRKGSAWLAGKMRAHCSSEVLYLRGQTWIIVHATFGRTDYELADELGLSVGSHVWDFLVAADELGLDPQAGDVIVTEDRRYEVMNLGGEGCRRWSDPYRKILRIHTRDAGPAE